MVTERSARIAVIGAGAVGTCVAWNLVRAGRDVTVCVRQKINRLVLRQADGEPVALPAVSVTDPSALDPWTGCSSRPRPRTPARCCRGSTPPPAQAR